MRWRRLEGEFGDKIELRWKSFLLRPSPRRDADAADDLMHNLVEPFVYRRYLDYGVFESLRKMKNLIEVEVSRRDLAANVKLGPGGIREVEFIVQSLQLVRGGADPALRRHPMPAAVWA